MPRYLAEFHAKLLLSYIASSNDNALKQKIPAMTKVSWSVLVLLLEIKRFILAVSAHFIVTTYPVSGNYGTS